MSSTLLLVIALICTCCIQFTVSFRWCCKSQKELRKCNHFRTLQDENGGLAFDFECVIGDGTDDCMQLLKMGAADVINLDGGDLFRYRDDISLVAAEDKGAGDASYYAVAVVKKNQNPTLSLHSLDGFKSCHTAIGKTAGWNMPMGWIARNGLNRAPFSESCVPGANNPIFQHLLPDTDYAKWCKLCVGNKYNEHACDRDNDERFYGYDGAFRCLQFGGGDVAFVKHTTVPDSVREDYELLCPDSPRRASPAEWRGCTIGRVPAHAVVMNINRATEENANQVLNALLHAKSSIQEFMTYGGKNLLWSSSTNDFIPRILMAPKEFMGIDYYCNSYALHHGSAEDECQSTKD